MSLGTLIGVKELGGFGVLVMDDLKRMHPERFHPESGAMDYEWFEAKVRPNFFIYVRNDVNSLSFTLQSAPVSEVGVNGCQVDSILAAAVKILEGMNSAVPSSETTTAIFHANMAIMALKRRTADRVARGVEGTSAE